MKAVIPVAGKGTRLYPLSITTPKPLTKILNKPLIYWNIDNLIAHGIQEVIFITSTDPSSQIIKDAIDGYTSGKNIQVYYREQEQQLGTADVLQKAADFFEAGEEFLFFYGDDLYGPENVRQLCEPGIKLLAKEVTDPSKWGIFNVDENSNLIKLVEKPSDNIGNLANIGCMRLSQKIFSYFDKLSMSVRGELELTDSIDLLAKDVEVKVIAATDYWVPVGYPWHILSATNELIHLVENKVEGEIESNVIIKGNVYLPKSSKILSGTYVEGNLVIGENSIIGPSVRVRGNVVLGNNSSIGSFVDIKNTVVGDNTKISHLCYIGDSVIGNSVNIASHNSFTNLRHDKANIKSMVKDKLIDTQMQKLGAIIGDGVKTGAATLIYPGRKIWPNKTTLPGERVERDIE